MMSDIGFFRDIAKNPDKYSYPGKVDKELQDELEADREERRRLGKDTEARPETLGPWAENYHKVISQVVSARLKPEFADDSKEAAILENRKKIAIEKLHNILEDIQRYVLAVNRFKHINKRSSTHVDLDKYQEEMREADVERRAVHNKLISDIKIFIRLSNINFNKNFPEDKRLELEKGMLDRKGMDNDSLKSSLAKREYYSFEKPGLIIGSLPSDPDVERGVIADWAFMMHGDLSRLDESLKEFLENKKGA